MKKTKTLAVLLALLVVLTFAACKGKDEEDVTTTQEVTTVTAPVEFEDDRTIKAEDYSEVTGDWEYISNVLPEFTYGRLLVFDFSYFEEGTFRTVDVEPEQFREYVSLLADEYFTEGKGKLEEADNGEMSYSGKSKSGVNVDAIFISGQVKVTVGR